MVIANVGLVSVDEVKSQKELFCVWKLIVEQ